MSEQQENQTPPEDQASSDEPKTFDAEYVEKLRKENAKYRTEAKANSDAAKRLAELEESQKTEQQKLSEALEASRKELESERTARLRADVANAKGVPAEGLTGSSKEEFEAAADRLLSWREEAAKGSNFNPNGGFYSGSSTRNSGDALTPKQQAAAALREMRQNH